MFLWLLMISLFQASAQENIEIKFLGWSSDSNEFGYLVNREIVKNGEENEKKTIYYVKGIASKGKLRDLIVPSGNIIKHIKKMGYAKYSLKKEHLSELVYKFPLETSRYVKFEVIVKKDLYYRLTIFSGVKSRVIIKGKFDDIYTKIEPFIYISPNGTYAVLVVKAKTPYSQKDFIRFFRIY